MNAVTLAEGTVLFAPLRGNQTGSGYLIARNEKIVLEIKIKRL